MFFSDLQLETRFAYREQSCAALNVTVTSAEQLAKAFFQWRSQNWG
ncbi:MAG: hypothetical protein ACLRSW_00575 [Christensenellaceae bacterium]